MVVDFWNHGCFRVFDQFILRITIALRIGIVAHLKHPVAEPFAGGLEMHTYLLATKLRERGHEVVVFASSRSCPSLGVEPICSETSLNELGDIESEDAAFFREHHAYLALMNRLRHARFDIIHNNSLHYLPIVMADALPMPLITTLHTPPFSWLASGVRIAGGLNLNLIAVSEAIRREWANVAWAKEVIPNGVDLTAFRYHPAPEKSPYAVWYGRIVPEKGLHYAMDAARLCHMKLKFAGPISDQAYFNEYIMPRMGHEAVYVGHLKHEELISLVGGAQVALCTPCWEEPYGLVVAEALACGVPVAAFARGAIPQTLTDASGVLAVPDDAQSLADATNRARRLCRQDCRHRAEAFCDAEVMIDGYETTYRRVLSQDRSIAGVDKPDGLLASSV